MPGDVRDLFGVHSGVRSGSVWANFGLKFSEPKIQKFSNCVAVAAAAGALRAAGLRTAAIEGPRRGGDGRTNFEILNVWLRKFWSEIGPNGPRTDHFFGRV